MQWACVAVDASLLLWGHAMRSGRAGAMLLYCVGCGCCIVWAAVAVLRALRAALLCADVCFNFFMLQFFTAPERPGSLM